MNAEKGVESVSPCVRFSRVGDRDAILRFISDMGFNPRDAKTWDELGMRGATAWRGDKLVGAIPLEPRRLQIDPGVVVPTVHVTVTALAPEFRGQGTGSELQTAIRDNPPGGAVAVTVFREGETGPAYRWYVKNGFEPVMRARSWFLDLPYPKAPTQRVLLTEATEDAVDWNDVRALWRSTNAAKGGGFVDREWRRLESWLPVHPYRGWYDFRVARLTSEGGALAAYALLGVGTLHSETVRVDILECAVEDDDLNLAEALLRGVAAFAEERHHRPIRWALSMYDPFVEVAERLRFQVRFEHDMLVRPLSGWDVRPISPMQRNRHWRYHSMDYI